MIIQPIKNNNFELLEEFEILGIKIPKNFKTNGANIPRVFWSIYPPFKPKYLKAIFLHDFLCENAKNWEDFKKAHRYLKEALKECGASKFTQTVFYMACMSYHFFVVRLKEIYRRRK